MTLQPIVGLMRHVPMVWEDGTGLLYGYAVDEACLSDEIAEIDEQRRFAQEANSVLDVYLERFLDALIESLQRGG